jgi:hypothetical protein
MLGFSAGALAALATATAAAVAGNYVLILHVLPEPVVVERDNKALHLLFIHTLIPPSPHNFTTNTGYANSSSTTTTMIVLPTQTSSNDP